VLGSHGGAGRPPVVPPLELEAEEVALEFALDEELELPDEVAPLEVASPPVDEPAVSVVDPVVVAEPEPDELELPCDGVQASRQSSRTE
jgi:hypothetical protein